MANMQRVKSKQSDEETEFPLVCETCLGDNPYVRMTKEPHGKKCQVCETPFTVFAWQAGTKGRLKRVEICKSCAQAKNVCQVCIYDLQYGLPVKVRDKVLRETAKGGEGGSSGGATTSMIPQSTSNLAWFTAQQKRLLDQGISGGASTGSELAHAKLSEMAQMEPRYERNLPKLCSFYARGECDRGSSCPFRHELPRDRNDPMSKQNTKDRFYGTSDPVANKILGRKRRQEEIQAQQVEDDGYDKARATLYLRFQGEEPYPHFTEMDVRDQFYAFGEIVSVRVQADRGQAFVEYSQPEAAELAIASMNRKELVGRIIYTSWARAPKRGESDSRTDQSNASTRNSSSSSQPAMVVRPVAPPGASHVNQTQVSLPKQGIPKVKLPPEVAAIAAVRMQRGEVGSSINATANVPRPMRGAAVPRPGAGVPTSGPSRGVVYPSTDPNRLGSKASSTSG